MVWEYSLAERLAIHIDRSSIGTAWIGARVRRRLHGIGATCLGDAVPLSDKQLRSIKGFGRYSLEHLDSRLETYDLRRGIHIDPEVWEEFEALKKRNYDPRWDPDKFFRKLEAQRHRRR